MFSEDLIERIKKKTNLTVCKECGNKDSLELKPNVFSVPVVVFLGESGIGAYGMIEYREVLDYHYCFMFVCKCCGEVRLKSVISLGMISEIKELLPMLRRR